MRICKQHKRWTSFRCLKLANINGWNIKTVSFSYAAHTNISICNDTKQTQNVLFQRWFVRNSFFLLFAFFGEKNMRKKREKNYKRHKNCKVSLAKFTFYIYFCSCRFISVFCSFIHCAIVQTLKRVAYNVYQIQVA